METLQDLMRERNELRLAERTGLTKEQVHRLNLLEATDAWEERGVLLASYKDDNDHEWLVAVAEDGSLDYTAGGCFPELAKWND